MFMKQVLKYNELFENKTDDLFNSDIYSDNFSVNISNIKTEILKKIKDFSIEYDYIPTEKTINEILTDVYYWTLTPETDKINDYFNDIEEELDLSNHNEVIIHKIISYEPKEWEVHNNMNKFNI